MGWPSEMSFATALASQVLLAGAGSPHRVGRPCWLQLAACCIGTAC